MTRNILCQSAYQLGITLWLVYGGKDVFGIDAGYLDAHGYKINPGNALAQTNDYLNTFVFNTFVLCQVSCRAVS
jgi:hypothetical protein